MSARPRSYIGAIVLITLGILFLLDNLGVAHFGDIISTYWPLILILIGIRIFVRYGHGDTQAHDNQSPITPGTGSQQLNMPFVNSSNVFGDLDLKVNSKEFRGGSISNTFGDMNIDLSEIELAEGEQLLKVDGVFGDLHVLVPKTIEIYVTAHSVFGDIRVLGNVKSGFGQDISYTSTNYASAGKKLRIVSHQVFGDVKVW
ncbi:MAG TPA: cell wall-active antibiotics response protein LiaF [Bacteroidota bacterium]|nr:cell wall-active antibiotics response protein LiaF [Bacteroidota bacterium]